MKSRIQSIATKIGCLGAVLLLSYRATAASVGVNIEPTDFNPSVVSINVGDQVVWTWVSNFHNTESTTDLWNSPIENTGYVFTNVFTSAGTFPYFCVVHSFTGEVDVNSGGATNAGVISVTLTNPADGSVFGNTDPVNIDALVNDTNGTVTNVSFFRDGVLLRSVATNPFVLITAPFTFSLGTHVLTATVADDAGLTATSAPVQLSIERYTPEVTNGVGALFLVPVATNLSAPLYGVSPPGDTHRLFVLEQNGLIRIIKDDVLQTAPALDLQALVQPPLNAGNPNDERGLLGLAFHPGFTNPASPGYQTLYTYNSESIASNGPPTYVVPADATNNYKNAINEWKISATNADVIDPTSRREVISFGKNAGNHNGGTCAFGPDGYYYLRGGIVGNANDVGPGHISRGG